MSDKETPKVVDLGSWKEQRIIKVWEHPCGGQQFFLHETGIIECVKCGDFLESIWGPAAD